MHFHVDLMSDYLNFALQFSYLFFRLEVPCTTNTGEKCTSPYGFKNHLRLDLDTSLFAVSLMYNSESSIFSGEPE